MRNTLILFAAIALTVLCWGLYGPTLQAGQFGMSTVAGAPARLRPFVCVGLAYFLIGVIVPWLWLYFWGEKGDWTLFGIGWSLAGGAFGALGAFGVILAFTFGGAPIYVMPLVFGGAPVVNAFLTIFLAGRMKEIGPMFLAGLVIVILGAVVVLLSAPHGKAHAAPPSANAEESRAKADAGAAVAENSDEAKKDAKEAEAAIKPTVVQAASAAVWSWVLQILAIALAIGSWGAYGPVLHKGQAAMHHSRMRPLICVGLAYFVIAVIVPQFFLAEMSEPSRYTFLGTMWSLLGGAFGAIGALGIILAFNSGGKPVFVMPLVFGGAPVINTLVAIESTHQWDKVQPFFWAGLILVIAGAAMVLVLAPRGHAPAPEAAPA